MNVYLVLGYRSYGGTDVLRCFAREDMAVEHAKRLGEIMDNWRGWSSHLPTSYDEELGYDEYTVKRMDIEGLRI